MNFSSFELVVLGLFAAFANVLGGLILLPSGIYQKFKAALKYLLALGAGFMLAVTFIELLPKTISLWQTDKNSLSAETLVFPMALLLVGYLLTQFFEHTIAPHFHLGEEVHSHGDHLLSTKSAYTAIGGLMIHTFFDGVSIAAASQVDYKAGLLVFIAVFLHKFPEGFTIASMILAAGKSFREVLFATSLVGLTTFIGVVSFLLIGQNIEFAINYALPVACGVTLYVAASDLIPEVNHHAGKRPLVSLSVFAGVALFFLLHFLLHALLEN
ncbi:MAG TPA: ZIP family metal transporter [Pyrinomonadaceae bacterium]|jgi:zinc transporter ZupT